MQILLTNDDGFYAPGLAAMARVLRRLGDVCIAAPEMEQSGAAMRMTFLQPVNVKKIFRPLGFWGYAVNGSPADCVKIGISELAACRPDLVVSGLNNGLNAGANILYSGTVGAAMEGAFQGITSFGVSMAYQTDPNTNDAFENAAEIAYEMISRLLKKTEVPGQLYNVNIPQEAIDRKTVEKIAVVPVDQKVLWNSYEQGEQCTRRNSFWLAGKPNYAFSDNETDLGKVSKGFITVTPLQPDRTNHDYLKKMRGWDLETALATGNETVKNNGTAGSDDNAVSPQTAQSEAMDFRIIRHYKM